MNPDAKAFFEANPEAGYWYYSPTLRVPNPQIKPWLGDHPWPDKEKND